MQASKLVFVLLFASGALGLSIHIYDSSVAKTNEIRTPQGEQVEVDLAKR